MTGCSAVNCSNSSGKGFRVFRFPKDPARRHVWFINCRRRNWEPTIHSGLCEAHFEESQYEQNRLDGWKKLKPNAVPTIFKFSDPDEPHSGPEPRSGPKPRSGLEPRSVLPLTKSVYKAILNQKPRVPESAVVLENASFVESDAIIAQSIKIEKNSDEELEINSQSPSFTPQEQVRPNRRPSSHPGRALSSSLNVQPNNLSNVFSHALSWADLLELGSNRTVPARRSQELSVNEVLGIRAENDAENTFLKNEIQKLRNTLETVLKRTVAKKEDVRREVVELELQVENSYQKLEIFLNEDQIHSLEKTKNNWSAETVIQALKFRHALGIHGYELLRKTGYPIPSYATLNRILVRSRRQVSPGILHNLLEPLKYKVLCMDPLDRLCCISIDELRINSTIEYQARSKEYVGYVTLGESGDKLLGTHLLLVLIRGLKTNWKQVIACEVTSQFTPKEKVTEFLLKCISYVENCGLRVVAFSSGVGRMNVGVWNSLKVYARKDGATRNCFRFNEHEIYAIPDVRQLLANLKNALSSQDFILPAEVVKAHGLPSAVVSGAYIKSLTEWAVKSNKVIRDLLPINLQISRIGRATRYFSRDIAAALSLAITFKVLPEEATTTAWFIQQVADWFELVTARQESTAVTRKNMANKLDFLTRFIVMFRDLKIGNNWKSLNAAIILASLSLRDISEMLLKPEGFYVLPTHRLNQDSIEKCFSKIRQRAGAAPSVGRCLAAIKHLTTVHLATEVTKSIYFNPTQFLLDHFSKEKRRTTPNPPPVFSFSTPDFSIRFDTVSAFSDNATQDLGNIDMNLLFLTSGECLHALHETILCELCFNILNAGTELVQLKFSNFVNTVIKGGLKFPNPDVLDLIINCELLHRKFFQYVLHNNPVNLIDKIVQDIEVRLPTCPICGDLKFFIVNHFFKIRCFSSVKLGAAVKKPLGAVSRKKRKITT